MVSKLYGILPGMAVQIQLKEISPYLLVPKYTSQAPLAPSQELINGLESIPEGRKIGLPIFPETYKDGKLQSPIQIGTAEVLIADKMRVYLQEVLNVAHARKLEIICLQDTGLGREFANYQAVLSELNLIQKENYLAKPEFNLSEAIRNTRIDIEYLETVRSGESILDTIRKDAELEAVILPLKYSEYIYSKRADLADEGIVFDYFREERNGTKARLVRNPVPNKHFRVHADHVSRQYNALHLGRILPGEAPDFIGEREYKGREEIFEIYFTGKGKDAVSGVMQDEFGSAEFTGKIGGGEILLNVRYGEDAVMSGATSEPVEYRGDMISFGLGCIGKFNAGPNEGGFTLRKFSVDRTVGNVMRIIHRIF